MIAQVWPEILGTFTSFVQSMICLFEVYVNTEINFCMPETVQHPKCIDSFFQSFILSKNKTRIYDRD